jgi:hypothetical protein
MVNGNGFRIIIGIFLGIGRTHLHYYLKPPSNPTALKHLTDSKDIWQPLDPPSLVESALKSALKSALGESDSESDSESDLIWNPNFKWGWVSIYKGGLASGN